MLYSAVGEWAQLDQDSTVLDVCCGTGTIGISLAKVTSLLRIIILYCCYWPFFYRETFIDFVLESEEGDWHRAVSGGSGGRQSQRKPER